MGDDEIQRDVEIEFLRLPYDRRVFHTEKKLAPFVGGEFLPGDKVFDKFFHIRLFIFCRCLRSEAGISDNYPFSEYFSYLASLSTIPFREAARPARP